ncbi:MAG: ABC transporter permease [Deltaproteobacteria bacterium]|nr:ABC transporter permease [Deltaproteobacteria bacterium]
MDYLVESLKVSLSLILALDPELCQAVRTSLYVSAWSVVLASLMGIPIGLAVGLTEFPFKRSVITLLNSMMAVPTVLIGLLVYGFVSRQGPFGGLGLLFTPAAIIIGDALLATPIVANLALSSVRGANTAILPTAMTLGGTRFQSVLRLLSEIRFGIMAAVISGFGRVVSEVGVAMMLGGNILGSTRTMTTVIALETSKGEFALGIALGLILMAVALAVNIVFQILQRR